MRKKANYTLEEIHEAYQKRGGGLDSAQYRDVCNRYNSEAMRHIIDHGRALEMGHGLSSIGIARMDRNYKKPRIDWGESNKLRKLVGEGEDWFVYFTDPYWYRFHWRKGKCRIPNRCLWKFIPSRGVKGTHTKLISLLKEDHQAKTRFDSIKHL